MRLDEMFNLQDLLRTVIYRAATPSYLRPSGLAERSTGASPVTSRLSKKRRKGKLKPPRPHLQSRCCSTTRQSPTHSQS